MSVTINAHQLNRLFDKAVNHMGSECIEVLNGIRLDADIEYLYAVASDRYTLAAARRRHDDQTGEPFARTIPAKDLRTVREWLDARHGEQPVTISTDTGRLIFTAPDAELRIAVTDNQEFFDWRGVLRGVVNQPGADVPFPALDAGFLGRWATAGDQVRIRLSAEEKAIVVFADDFIGAQMPRRYSGVGPVPALTFGAAREGWGWTLVGGAEGLDMAADMPAEDEQPRYEVTTDIRETGADLLKQVLRSTTDMHDTSTEDREKFYAHATTAVNGWTAYRFLAALYKADPRLAAETVSAVAGELDSGEIGEFAWDAATEAGHDPKAWADEYEAHLAKRQTAAAAA